MQHVREPHIPVRGRSAYVIIPYSIASLTVKHASAIQGKLGEVGSRVRGALTCSMFGNLTGTYPGIQAAFYEPERQLKATQLGQADCQAKVGFRSGGPGEPGVHQFFNEVKAREVGSGTLASQREVGARMLSFLTALHP